MLITDLDYLESVSAEDISGGNRTNRALSLSIVNGSLLLKLGDTVLFQRAVELPKTISFSLDDASLLFSSCTTRTVNGVTRSVCKLTLQAPGSATASTWSSLSIKRTPL